MANPFFVQPPQYGQGLQSLAGSVQQFGQQKREQQQLEEQQQYEQRAKQAMAEAFQSGDPAAVRSAVIQFPEIAETATQLFGFTNEQTEQVARETYRRVLSDPENADRYLDAGIETVTQFGGRPNTMTRDLQMFRENPEAALRNIRAGYAAMASDQEYESVFGGGRDVPAGVREFQAKVEAAGLEPGSEEYQRAALVALGLEPKAGISASERIAQDPELSRRVTELERQTAAAKESGKLETQEDVLPRIRAKVKQAEQEAQSRGEAVSELNRARASLPGLREVVGKLKTLSDVATYTMGGRAFDTVVRELGFGSTEGATARAKMQSLVDNQILPLLRDTFGAQFTEREGERLRQTMLDINAPPEEKKQILDSFLEQKMRDLETMEARAEPESQQGPEEGEDIDSLVNKYLEQ